MENFSIRRPYMFYKSYKATAINTQTLRILAHMCNIAKLKVVSIVAILLLSACSSESEQPLQDGPETVAITFFDAIYNQNDIDKALESCTPELAQELRTHVSTKNLARQIFNMSFDSVEIDAAFGDLRVREEFRNTGKLTIVFTGYRQNKLYKDMRDIKLIKQNGRWLVSEILPDPMAY